MDFLPRSGFTRGNAGLAAVQKHRASYARAGRFLHWPCRLCKKLRRCSMSASPWRFIRAACSKSCRVKSVSPVDFSALIVNVRYEPRVGQDDRDGLVRSKLPRAYVPVLGSRSPFGVEDLADL